MLAQGEVLPELMDGLLKRLQRFVEPFSSSLAYPGQRRHAAQYMTGLLSKLERRTGEAIAYLLNQERQVLQKFVGFVSWHHHQTLSLLAAWFLNQETRRKKNRDAGLDDATI